MKAVLVMEDGKFTLNGKSKDDLSLEEEILLNEMFKQFRNENFADLLEKTKQEGRVVGLKVQFLVDKL